MNSIFGLILGAAALPVLILISGVISLIVAWPVMLLVGNAAIESGGTIPSLGYWTTFWLTWALAIVTGGNRVN